MFTLFRGFGKKDNPKETVYKDAINKAPVMLVVLYLELNKARAPTHGIMEAASTMVSLVKVLCMTNLEELRPKEVSSTMDSSNMEREKVKEPSKLKMEFFRVISKTMKLTVQENLSGKTVKFMKDSSENQCLTVREE
jgi:hypothetical protein